MVSDDNEKHDGQAETDLKPEQSEVSQKNDDLVENEKQGEETLSSTEAHASGVVSDSVGGSNENMPIDPETDPFIIEMEKFSGPLDLLLHLIKKHEMDIFDIPISTITQRYLEYVKVIQELNLDMAGDFLVMAATLAHIKSRMLLPPGEEEEEEEEEQGDPREELVRRLLEYQKYKQIAETLQNRPILGRDVFIRPPEKSVALKDDEVDVEEVSVFQLIEIFQELLENAKKHAPHQIQLDSVKVEDKIVTILHAVRQGGRIPFRSLFVDVYSRPDMVATFLGILELTRLRAMRIYQTSDKGEIYISIRENAPSDEEIVSRLASEQKSEEASEELKDEAEA